MLATVTIVGGEKPSAAPLFVDVAERAGIRFQHRDGRSGKRYYVETAASGGGWIDFDDDGDLDLYLVNGALTPGSPDMPAPKNTLYENRDGTFIDVSEHAGVDDTGYGMGLCTGDFDADGNLDLFVTNFGPDRLFRNRGDGTFEEVADRAGVAGDSWGTACAFGDIDGDGDLDLFVANYVAFAYQHNRLCSSAASRILSYCRPDAFKGQPDYLYINQGDGTFREEGRQRGLAQGRDEKGFGAVLSDLDEDGDLDILVANDGTMNRFYLNDGKGRFEDISLLSGFGFNGDGEAESGMGIGVGDLNGDNLNDIFVTNYAGETNTLHLNQGGGFLEDYTRAAGLVSVSRVAVGWGIGLFDMDNDRDLDIAVANGHVMDNIAQIQQDRSYPQPNHLLENSGSARFSDRSARAGPGFTTPAVSRGLAVGDVNNDGRLDLLITNTNGRINLLENRIETNHRWLGLILRGPPENPFAIGARVRLHAGTVIGPREVRSGGSFLSQSDLRLHFGLGTYTGAIRAEIIWPDGARQQVAISETNRYLKVVYAPTKGQ